METNFFVVTPERGDSQKNLPLYSHQKKLAYDFVRMDYGYEDAAQKLNVRSALIKLDHMVWLENRMREINPEGADLLRAAYLNSQRNVNKTLLERAASGQEKCVNSFIDSLTKSQPRELREWQKIGGKIPEGLRFEINKSVVGWFCKMTQRLTGKPDFMKVPLINLGARALCI